MSEHVDEKQKKPIANLYKRSPHIVSKISKFVRDYTNHTLKKTIQIKSTQLNYPKSQTKD